MRRLLVLFVVLGLLLVGPAAVAPPAGAIPRELPKQPTAVGSGGAVSTFDPLATDVALEVLRKGGNAVDAAVAAAGVLSVTEPFLSGIGGGGFLVVHLAGSDRVVTLDHRERAPASMRADTFLDPATGRPLPFAEAMTSGLSVGVPGTVAGWHEALRRWGTQDLRTLLKPAVKIARHGFVVDEALADMIRENLDRFRDFTSTRAVYLTPSGDVPPVGSVLRNRDLSDTLELIANQGPQAFYSGPVAADIARTVQSPPLVDRPRNNVRPGGMTTQDLASYRVALRQPTAVPFLGYEVYSMGPPSSGGSTVGEALNILEQVDLAGLSRAEVLHRMIEASRLAFADRNAYLADADFVPVPLRGLLSDGFAAERAALVRDTAAPGAVAPGDPWPYNGSGTARAAALSGAHEGISTTHLTVADRWGNVASYTFTIEAIGGSGMVVPGRGFLLNNELTDFDFRPGLPNSPAPGKRPRSSMSPTIVLRDGAPVLALGAAGGPRIITSVLQVLVDRLVLNRPLPEALAAPRVSQRNQGNGTTEVEPAFLDLPEASALGARGHRFTTNPQIAVMTAVELLPGGTAVAAAEPTRRGGGAAGVVRPAG